MTVDRAALGAALARVQGVVERRSTHPLLGCVLLESTAVGLRVSATDTEVGYETLVPASEVRAAGAALVEAAGLFQVARSMPEAAVSLVSSGETRRKLVVRAGRAEFKLPGHDPVDFPGHAPFTARGTARLTEAALLRMIECCAPAVSKDDVRYGLNGARVQDRGLVDGVATLRMVATDGHRMAMLDAPIEGTWSQSARELVPRKALRVLEKLLDGGEDQVAVEWGDSGQPGSGGAIRVQRGDESFWFRMIDGEFPDYENVVPKETTSVVTVDREALVGAMKRSMIVQGHSSRALAFRLADDGTLTVQTLEGQDRGDSSEQLTTEYAQRDLTGAPKAAALGFNPRYVLEVLSCLRGPAARLEFSNPLAPTRWSDPADPAALFVIMPMRLD